MDAASNNGVDAMRELVDQVMVAPTQGRYRVFIIDEVHMLSNAAFNAFLKTLEEPPAHVYFHSGNHRETQDHTYDSVTMPDL